MVIATPYLIKNDKYLKLVMTIYENPNPPKYVNDGWDQSMDGTSLMTFEQ